MTTVPLRLVRDAEHALTFPAPPDAPVLRFEGSDRALTDQLLAPLRGTGPLWWVLFAVSCAGTALFVFSCWYTIAKGGEAGSRTAVLALGDPPARGDARKIEDDGNAAQAILDFLAEKRLV